MIKIKLDNCMSQEIISLITTIIEVKGEELGTMDSIILSEVITLLCKDGNKIKLTYSQAFCLFLIFRANWFITPFPPIFIMQQIEKQLFQESQIGFNILSKGIRE